MIYTQFAAHNQHLIENHPRPNRNYTVQTRSKIEPQESDGRQQACYLLLTARTGLAAISGYCARILCAITAAPARDICESSR